MAWNWDEDGALNEVPASIGVTARDHESISAWEEATDEDCTAGWGEGIYDDPCSPVGDCYDDADFEEDVDFDGATTGATHFRRLTVHEGQRHAGKEGAGATLILAGDYPLKTRDLYCIVEWLLLTGSGQYSGPYYCPENSRHMFRNIVSTLTGAIVLFSSSPGSGTESTVRNCIMRGMLGYGINTITYSQNCSIYGTGSNLVRSSACTNVISCGGTSTCFYLCSGDYNIGSDATAPGGNSIDNIAGADLFVNVANDLHLKAADTAAASVGSDLSADFTDDIDDDTRSDWDIGADEYDDGAPAGSPYYYDMISRQMRDVA